MTTKAQKATAATGDERKPFDRETNGLKAKVQFIRGATIKAKGEELTAEEIDRLTDDNVADLEMQGIVEITTTAAQPEGPAADDAA